MVVEVGVAVVVVGWVFVMGHLWVQGGDGGGRWFLGFVWAGHDGYAAWFLGHNRFAMMVVWCGGNSIVGGGVVCCDGDFGVVVLLSVVVCLR